MTDLRRTKNPPARVALFLGGGALFLALGGALALQFWPVRAPPEGPGMEPAAADLPTHGPEKGTTPAGEAREHGKDARIPGFVKDTPPPAANAGHREDVRPRQGASAPAISSPLTPALAPAPSNVPYAIDREGIRAAVHAGRADIRDCYEQWLQFQPDLSGEMRIHFTIERDDAGAGRVSRVSIPDGGLGNPAFDGCVALAFQGMTFEPPPDGRIEVNYPLVFSTGAPDGG